VLILKSLPSAVAEILKGNPKFLGDPLTQATPTFYSGCDFIMGIGKPQLHAKFEIASFIYYGNIRELVFKNWDKPKFGNPLFLEILILPLEWIRRPNVSFPMYNFCRVLTAEWVILQKAHFIVENFKSWEAGLGV